MFTRICSSTGINPHISSWAPLSSGPSFDFPYFFLPALPLRLPLFLHLSSWWQEGSFRIPPPLHSYLWFSHFSQALLWKKAKSYLSRRHCADLITDFTALYRQADITDQVKILALTCFSSLTAVLLLHLLMETNFLLNPYCLKKQSRKPFSELYIFFFHVNCTDIFLWIPSVLSIFVLQFQICFFLCAFVWFLHNFP